MITSRWLPALVGAVTLDVISFSVLDEGPWSGHRPPLILEVCSDALTVITLLVITHLVVSKRRELFRNRQLLAATEATTPDWIWQTDAQHRYTFCSDGVRRLLGYDPDELLGKEAGAFIAAGEDREQLRRGSAHLQQARSEWRHVDVAWRHKHGHAVVLRGSAAPIFDEAERLIGYRGTRVFVSSDADVTELITHARRRISDVVANEAVEIALQPIVGLTDGRLVGVEALARFEDGRGPDVWFREARDTSQTLELDRLTFDAALRTLEALPASTYLSINASPELVLDDRFRADLVHHPRLHQLVIEITEHEKVADYVALTAVLAPLRQRGLRVAVDDAGAGYASLTHILHIRPDIIKLDRELLSDIDEDRARRSLVTALVLLALDLGATVTGEGVETPGQLITLDALAVESVQGYVLARPTTERSEWMKWRAPWTQITGRGGLAATVIQTGSTHKKSSAPLENPVN